MFRRLDANTTYNESDLELVNGLVGELLLRLHTLLLEYSTSEEQIQANILYKRSGTTVSLQSRSSSVGGHVITGFISVISLRIILALTIDVEIFFIFFCFWRYLFYPLSVHLPIRRPPYYNGFYNFSSCYVGTVNYL